MSLVFVAQKCIKNGTGSPTAKDGMKNGMWVGLITNSWLLGLLYTKRKTDYDYDEYRLK